MKINIPFRRLLGRLLQCCVVVSGLVALYWRVLGQETIKPGRDRGPLVQQYVRPLLDDPSFVRLDWSQPVSWRQGEYGSVHLPDEKPDHQGGVFRRYDMTATVYSTDPLRASVSGESQVRVLDARQRYPSREECKLRALQFLRTAFPWFFAMGALPTIRMSEPGNEATWGFRWQRYGPDELPTVGVDAWVRAIDGRVVAFAGSKFIGPWPHKIKASEAVWKALQVAARATSLKETQVLGWEVTGHSGRTFYQVSLEARSSKSGELLAASVLVDAMTGKIGSRGRVEEVFWEPMDRDARDPREITRDRLPVWTNQGLVFVSERKLSAMPAWAVFRPQLFLQDHSNKIAHLTADLAASPTATAGLISSSWIAVERKDWTYAFDLRTGDYRVLGDPERPGPAPAIDMLGHWAVVVGSGRDKSSDSDLLPDDLQRTPKLGLRGRLMHTGDDHRPVFSPDGKWLYFVTTINERDKTIRSLHRISTAASLTRDLKRLDENQLETVVRQLPEPVDRLSMFPGGQRLLAQSPTTMYSISIADHRVAPVSLKELKDPELGGVAIQEVQDGWAGPTDDRVTFSGKAIAKDGKIRQRIYSCHLDGSNVKALTPRENDPVPAYHFPEGEKKTATDLAKAWALGEIEFDAAAKRRER